MKPQVGCYRSPFRSLRRLSCWWTTRPSTCARLDRILTPKGFAVTCVSSTRAALDEAAETAFAYAVVEMPPGRGSGLQLIKELHELHAPTRIVVTTDHDSFAAVILALRAGAADYLPKPLGEDELVDALLGRTPTLPPVPETPLRLQRICWEHIQRILAQCGHNLSEAARRLRMHRRTLQRILSKRAPYPRRMQLDDTTADLRVGAVARSYGRALHSRMHRQE